MTTLESIARRLECEGVPIERHGTYFLIPNSQAIMSVQERPGYCDRGRFQFLATSRDPLRLSIDSQDMFPRYYFGGEACASEIVAWMRARKLLKENV